MKIDGGIYNSFFNKISQKRKYLLIIFTDIYWCFLGAVKTDTFDVENNQNRIITFFRKRLKVAMDFLVANSWHQSA